MAAMTSYPAGDQIPITRTFVQGSATTAIGLVGQVLNDGKTNWVGYDEGSAFYILASSTANAEPTSLADGQTYFVSEGKAPAGYLATSGSAGDSGSMDMTATATSDSGASETSSSSMDLSTSAGDSPSMTDSAAPTSTSPSAGQRVSKGGVLNLVLGLLAVFQLNVMV